MTTAVVLSNYIRYCCWLFVGVLYCPCFVIQYLVSFKFVQSSRWGRVCIFLMVSASWSAVRECGISLLLVLKSVRNAWLHYGHFSEQEVSDIFIIVLWTTKHCINIQNFTKKLLTWIYWCSIYEYASVPFCCYRVFFIILNLHSFSIQCDTFKVRKRAKIRNRYYQAPHQTKVTNGKVTTSQLDITNESQEVSPFPAGDHNASTNRRAWKHNKTRKK